MVITRVKASTRHKSKRGNDDISGGDFEEFIPRGARLTSISNLLKHHILVEVDAVEPTIK